MNFTIHFSRVYDYSHHIMIQGVLDALEENMVLKSTKDGWIVQTNLVIDGIAHYCFVSDKHIDGNIGKTHFEATSYEILNIADEIIYQMPSISVSSLEVNANTLLAYGVKK